MPRTKVGRYGAGITRRAMVAANMANWKIMSSLLGICRQMLPKLQEKYTNICNDIERFEGFIHQLEEHRDSLHQKISSRSTDLAHVEGEIEKIRSEVS